MHPRRIYCSSGHLEKPTTPLIDQHAAQFPNQSTTGFQRTIVRVLMGQTLQTSFLYAF